MSERVFTASDGKLWRRGSYLESETAEKLLPRLRSDPDLSDLADELCEAMETLSETRNCNNDRLC